MKTLALSIAVAATVVAAPASAESVEVRHSDLNLASAEGQRALNGRIRAAAREVCGVSTALKTGPGRATKALRCAREAEANALKSFAAAPARSISAG